MSIFGSNKIRALLWALLTGFLLLFPGRSGPDMEGWLSIILFTVADKFVHAFLFFVLVFLGYRGVDPARSSHRALRLIMFAAFLYALALETAQYWVPNRAVDGLDVGAGVVGIVAARVVVVRRTPKNQA